VGLKPGELVTGWMSGDRSGTIDSPFELARVEQAEAARGKVTLVVRQGFRTRHIAMPPDRWKIASRPALGPAELASHLQAKALSNAGETERAVSVWHDLAEKLSAEGRPDAAAWCRLRCAAALAEERRDEDALGEAGAAAGLFDRPLRRALAWERAGAAFLEVGRRKPAGIALTNSIQQYNQVGQASPAVAFTLLELVSMAHRTHGEEARKALEIYQQLDPQGMGTARALYQQALCSYVASRYDRTESLARRALSIVERTAPQSPLAVDILGRLGTSLLDQGALDEARTIFTRELDAAVRIDPTGPQAGYACNHLGLAAKALGEYQQAREWYLRGLEIYRRCRPGGVEVAGMLNNLGNVANKQDDWATALHYHQQALAIRERLHPGGRDVAASLNNIGSIERQMGQLDAARGHLERALELKRKNAPGSWTLANTLTELGMTATAQGRYAEAGRLYAEALEIKERAAPGSPWVADIVFLQGSLAEAQGRAHDCERLWRQAISMAERNEGGPGLSEHELSRFGARFYQYYDTLARYLARNERAGESFELMERARARALRSMLLGAKAVPAGVPPRLWFSYRRTLREIERERSRMARHPAGAGTKPGAAGAREEMARLMPLRDRLRTEILTAAPRLAGLHMPAPPTVEEVRRALDPGTVLLSYIVGEKDTALLVVGGSNSAVSIRSFTIPVGSAELQRRIDLFRAFIARGRRSPTVDDALVSQGRKLFRLLVAPALSLIEPSQRVLIVPDGPLREAPFAALALPGEPVRFLGTWKPLFFNSSAGSFLAIRSRGRGRRTGAGIVAFAGPHYPPGSPNVQAWGLRPLLGSRDEVRRIAVRFGGQARLFLGSDASEENLRSLDGTVRYLHLAVHSRSDPRFPLESALFLSMPEAPGAPPEHDGVLHAWEIMDSLHLKARVVTLSGCSTGCGERVAGEGVLGLARAFQYAGADTLVVSQWAVSDCSTCELMDQYYAGLVRGLGTAEALQAAQSALVRAPLQLEKGGARDFRHPFHWAAFQVIGDWR